MAELDRARAAIEAAGVRAEIELRTQRSVPAVELEALGEFRLHVRRRRARNRHTESRRRCGTWRNAETAMLEARRRCRLLERLKERRLAEWTRERDRELEEVASESFLARWRQGAPI